MVAHPDSTARDWALVWFAKYSFYFTAPMVVLFLLFHGQKWWFLGLSTYWALAIAYFATRAVNERVRRWWRIGLAAVIISSWGFFFILVNVEPGDTKICYDRLYKPHRWAATVNIGPDPLCDGIPVDQVDLK